MWIQSVLPSAADGELKEIYDRVGGARGGVAAIHQAQSLNPRVLATHFELYKALMFQPSPLSRADREALAVAVSRANACEYCAAHHGAALHQLSAGSSRPPQLFEWLTLERLQGRNRTPPPRRLSPSRPPDPQASLPLTPYHRNTRRRRHADWRERRERARCSAR